MDLIYTNAKHEDVGVLSDYTFDLAFGSGENDFELTLDVNHHCCDSNCLVYIENTEYGGIVDEVNVLAKDAKLSYRGRTWHGILASKVIVPTSGAAYYTVSGEANSVLRNLVKTLGLTDLFTVSEGNSGLRVNNYSFARYTDAYSGITEMLASISAKLKVTFSNGKVVLSALPLVDYSRDEQFDSDQVELEVEKTYNPVNHLVCLGRGELENRQVIHLYADANGNVSEKQTFFGLKEIMDVYDYPNTESLDELKKNGVKKLKEYATKDRVQMNFTAEDDTYDVGDIVGAKEITTGVFAAEKITKKIVTIKQGVVNVNYKVGG